MWHDYRDRTDRILAAIEIPALGIWTGAQIGFAFLFAPIAFKALADPQRFGGVVAPIFAALGTLGYACLGVALAVAIVRAARADERTADIFRSLAILIALGLLFYHQRTIVAAMAAIPDVASAPYHALHDRSRIVYGGIVLLSLGALIAAAARPRNRI
jgi:predicted acyltransferase